MREDHEQKENDNKRVRLIDISLYHLFMKIGNMSKLKNSKFMLH
jgi:hypothetical protein